MSIYKPTLLDKFKDFVNGLKSNWDEYEDHVEDFETAKGIITDTFDETRTYAVGDYAIYENVLYKCVEAIEEAGEWDADKWAATNIAEEFKSHQAESATEGNPHGINSELNLRPRIISSGTGTSTLLNNLELSPRSLYLLLTGTSSAAMRSLYLIATLVSDGGVSAIKESPHITITFSGLNISVVSAYSTTYSLIKLN